MLENIILLKENLCITDRKSIRENRDSLSAERTGGKEKRTPCNAV